MRFVFKTSYAQDLGLFRDGVQRNWYLALFVGLLVLPVLVPTYLVACVPATMLVASGPESSSVDTSILYALIASGRTPLP